MTRLLPIVAVLTYLTLSIVVFAFGPWEYPIDNGPQLYLFVALAHLALLLGYLAGIRRPGRGYYWHWNPDQLVIVSALVSVLFIFPTSLLNTGRLIPDVIAGITDPGDVYARYQELRIAETPYAAYLRMTVGPLLAMVLPLTAFYWSGLRPAARLAGSLAIVGNLALFVAMGVNQGVLLPVVLGMIIIAAALITGRMRWSRRRIAVTLAAGVGALFLALQFFRTTVLQRVGSIAATGTFEQIHAEVDRDHFMLRPFDVDGQVAVLGLTSYLGQGYYGLSLAMDKPFVPMYGVGHSTFLYRQAARLAGNPAIEHLAYPERISDEDGWTVVQFFQTIYPWLASDVTFPGTLLVVALIGFVLARVWADLLRGDNPFAIAFLGPLVTMLLYFPALNAALQGGEGVSAFWGLFVFWLLSRRHFAIQGPAPAVMEAEG